MATRNCQCRNTSIANHEHDFHDVEMDELRRQVQQLQQQLKCLQVVHHDDPSHGLENDEEEEATNLLFTMVNLIHLMKGLLPIVA